MQSIAPAKTVFEPRRKGSDHYPESGAATPAGQPCRLTFSGALTLANCRGFEKKIVDALKRYGHLELDLGGVSEIDVYGIHLLALLQRVADRKIRIVACSPAIECATRPLASAPFAPMVSS